MDILYLWGLEGAKLAHQLALEGAEQVVTLALGEPQQRVLFKGCELFSTPQQGY